MRKVMVLVAMLAMVLVLAAPAFAQTTFVVEQEVEQFGVVSDSISSQVYNVAVQQVNTGDQVAIADADALAVAVGGEATAVANANAVNVANAAFVDIETTNVSLNNVGWGWW
jgi:hypothetical protein